MDFANRFCGFGKAKQKKARICPKSLSYSSCLNKESWKSGNTQPFELVQKDAPSWSPVALFVQHEEGASTSIPWTWVKWPSFKSGALSTMSWWRMGPHLKRHPVSGDLGKRICSWCAKVFFGCPCCCVSIVSFELFIDISGSGQFFGLLPMLFLENIWVIWAFFFWWGLESSQSKWDFFFLGICESVSKV